MSTTTRSKRRRAESIGGIATALPRKGQALSYFTIHGTDDAQENGQ